MSWCEVRRKSEILGKHVGLNVLVPDAGKPPFATFYLLHGLSDDYTIWMRRTRIEAYVCDLPLIVVMPDGFRSFYTNSQAGARYGDYIAIETVDFIDRTFPTIARRGKRAIGGLSMGGYGALRLGLSHPERFCSVTSHSGALLRAINGRSDSIFPEHESVFGKKPKGSRHDLLSLARQARPLPKIRIDCGTEDHLIEDNRKVHEALTRLKVRHEYQEFAGGHTWDYWDLHVRDAIAFHLRNMHVK
jgi:S-formylglutathione hydrolase FrmB